MNNITKILSNSIVTGWIAPIITAILASLILKLLSQKKHTKKTIDTVAVANSKILDAIRPLFIQKIYVDKKILDDIIKAIALEYDLDIGILINLSQIKEKLIYDILTTRFMDEKEKIDTIKNLYDNFSGYECDDDNIKKKDKFQDDIKKKDKFEDNIKEYSNILEVERRKLTKINKRISNLSILLSLSACIASIGISSPDIFEYIRNSFNTTWLINIVTLIITGITTYLVYKNFNKN